VKQLDLLRAVAVFLVLGHHMPRDFDAAPWPLSEVLRAWYECGWTGVDLFFVLSGFLVSGLLFREYKAHGSIRLRNFLVRRGLKIYPGFYALLLATVVVQPWVTGQPVWKRAVVVEALFLQNYQLGLNTYTWTLAVEEHFYILLSVLLFFLVVLCKGQPFRFLPWVFLGVVGMVLALRVATLTLCQPFMPLTHMWPTHLRIDALFFGVVLSYYYHFEAGKLRRVTQWRWTLLLVSLGVLLAPFLAGEVQLMKYVGLTCLYLGFGGVLLFAMAVPGSKALALRAPAAVVAFIGTYSYSIYLWHIPFAAWLMPLAKRLAGWELP
jgi:peptidoglycan/LPS O-acetylase OafA/YrhL